MANRPSPPFETGWFMTAAPSEVSLASLSEVEEEEEEVEVEVEVEELVSRVVVGSEVALAVALPVLQKTLLLSTPLLTKQEVRSSWVWSKARQYMLHPSLYFSIGAELQHLSNASELSWAGAAQATSWVGICHDGVQAVAVEETAVVVVDILIDFFK